MKDLSGKRLLILGGNRETGSLVQFANSIGVHTIVVDPNPNALAKKYAAESYDIDGFDVDAIVNLAVAREVDGVLVGVADILVIPYRQVCEKLQLPCYASSESVAALSSKSGFKAACEVYAVQDIPGMVIQSEVSVEDIKTISLPVMVKPVDNGGGIGMRICNTHDEVAEAVKSALSHSRQSKALVERVMSGDDMFAYYTFIEGQAHLSATADRITTKLQGELSPVCIAARYPSRHTSEFVRTVHPALLRMFTGIGVKNGVLCIQFFVQDGSYFAYDPGFRLQGEAPHIYLKEINGFDHRQMLIHFALTGSMGIDDFAGLNDYYFKGLVAGTFWILLSEGRIERIVGLNEMNEDPNVIAVLQRMTEGDQITTDMIGTERQVLARIYVVADSLATLTRKSQELRSRLEVTGEDGQNLVLDWVDANSLIPFDHE